MTQEQQVGVGAQALEHRVVGTTAQVSDLGVTPGSSHLALDQRCLRSPRTPQVLWIPFRDRGEVKGEQDSGSLLPFSLQPR